MPNMREIAKLAGVSVWTVSMALRDHPGVSEDTRKRIKSIAEEYHYLPNRLSQGTISGNSGLLGYITHRDIGPSYTDILQGALYQAYLEGFHMLVLQTSKEEIPHISHAIRDLLELRVEGIMVVSSVSDPLPNDLLMTIRSAGAIPVCVMETHFSTPVDRVSVDYDAVLALQVEHLRRLGHQYLAHISYDSPAWEQRTEKLRELVAAAGLMITSTHRVSTAPMAEMAFEALTATSPEPTGVMITSDLWAWPILRRVALCNIRIPQDMSIIGAGNLYNGTLFPELTTVDLHSYQTGREAVSLIRRRLNEGTPPAEITPETILLKPDLIVRGTTARCTAVKV